MAETASSRPESTAELASSGADGVTHSVRCRWTLTGFNTSKQLWSPYFTVAGSDGREHDGRVLIYPSGDSQALPGYVSVYLQLSDPGNSSKWDVFASYRLSIGTEAQKGREVLSRWCDFAPHAALTEPGGAAGSLPESVELSLDITILAESTSFSRDPDLSGRVPGASDPCMAGKFLWTVQNFTAFQPLLKTQKIMSPAFTAGDIMLRLSVYVSALGDGEWLSLCLESKDGEVKLQPERSTWCLFRLSVNAQPGASAGAGADAGSPPLRSVQRDSYGRLAADVRGGENTSLGWNDFMALADFAAPPYLVGDTAVFAASFQSDYAARFTWRIDNFTRLKDVLKRRKIQGLCIKSRRFTPPASLDWTSFVSHRLAVVNQRAEDRSVAKESQNRYSCTAKDWGWRDFVSLTTLFDADAGFLVNDAVVFTADAVVLKEACDVRSDGACPVKTLMTWRVDNLAAFKDILETRKIFSRFFPVGPIQLRIGLYDSLESLCIYLEGDLAAPSPFSAPGGGGGGGAAPPDPPANHWVRYRLSVVNQRAPEATEWREASLCTRSWNNGVLQFPRLGSLLDATAGPAHRDALVVSCEVLEVVPWPDFRDSGASPGLRHGLAGPLMGSEAHPPLLAGAEAVQGALAGMLSSQPGAVPMFVASLRMFMDSLPRVRQLVVSMLLADAPPSLLVDLLALVPKLIEPSEHDAAVGALLTFLAEAGRQTPDLDRGLWLPVLTTCSALCAVPFLAEHELAPAAGLVRRITANAPSAGPAGAALLRTLMDLHGAAPSYVARWARFAHAAGLAGRYVADSAAALAKEAAATRDAPGRPARPEDAARAVEAGLAAGLISGEALGRAVHLRAAAAMEAAECGDGFGARATCDAADHDPAPAGRASPPAPAGLLPLPACLADVETLPALASRLLRSRDCGTCRAAGADLFRDLFLAHDALPARVGLLRRLLRVAVDREGEREEGSGATEGGVSGLEAGEGREASGAAPPAPSHPLPPSPGDLLLGLIRSSAALVQPMLVVALQSATELARERARLARALEAERAARRGEGEAAAAQIAALEESAARGEARAAEAVARGEALRAEAAAASRAHEAARKDAAAAAAAAARQLDWAQDEGRRALAKKAREAQEAAAHAADLESVLTRLRTQRKEESKRATRERAAADAKLKEAEEAAARAEAAAAVSASELAREKLAAAEAVAAASASVAEAQRQRAEAAELAAGRAAELEALRAEDQVGASPAPSSWASAGPDLLGMARAGDAGLRAYLPAASAAQRSMLGTLGGPGDYGARGERQGPSPGLGASTPPASPHLKLGGGGAGPAGAPGTQHQAPTQQRVMNSPWSTRAPGNGLAAGQLLRSQQARAAAAAAAAEYAGSPGGQMDAASMLDLLPRDLLHS
ncbi:Ubiquitin carboxyl-terminal hydrolase 12 [Auxenochlorella protothecoides]|uniref:Ubiquitin carboxyl-terminal hydrolase 12 n=1 Tax=Auxenochlorella protothecoides TaxID=3075 RepID=A0A087SPH1_AUXPR|nr:Ubiquitin carboxyl-terminal hydrolase 12 [Auxenochlorella protothecoides]KFM27625.1 Ubiquitin carboxyl-terminal hydrolase 12 [Auxenochlorella protothecoides]